MPSNIDQFIKETNAEIKKLQDKQVKEAKKIIITTYAMIVDNSPVDTGLFRANNLVTYNSKTNETVDNPSLKDIENKAIIERAKLMHGDTMTIQNNLVYADRIEAGWSTQAPAGVYGVAEAIIRRKLAKRIVIR